MNSRFVSQVLILARAFHLYYMLSPSLRLLHSFFGFRIILPRVMGSSTVSLKFGPGLRARAWIHSASTLTFFDEFRHASIYQTIVLFEFPRRQKGATKLRSSIFFQTTNSSAKKQMKRPVANVINITKLIV